MMKINFSTWLSILFMGFIFLPLHINNIVIGIFILHTIYRNRNRIGWNLFKESPVLLMLIIPFFVFGLSVFISNDWLEGWKMLEKKLCLFIFPLIISIHQPDEREWNKSLLYLLFVFVAVTILCLLYQFYGFVIGVGDSGMFYNDLLIGLLNMQAVYFSWYVTIFMVIVAWLKVNQKLSWKSACIVMSYLLVINILLASRIALFLSLIVVAVFIIIRLRKVVGLRKSVFIGALLMGCLSTSVILFPQTFNRVKSIGNTTVNFNNTNPINHFNGEIKKENWNGLNTRLAIWACAVRAIRKNVLVGFGIGDTEKALREAYEEKNFVFGLTNNFNSHNQYLDILLNAGVIGFLIILGAWFKLIQFAIKKVNYLLLIFIAISLLVMLTENILNRNQGVFFFSFFISLFSLFNFKKEVQV